ncbi:LAME_0H15280g1_1 [Lachancea meyersii CBS 8951]|uniref:Large ribosomal subunit protein mL49 n=1 Tax=Lachancea meyersii CBS 8951 TaxID=1266667 RepID=A0A1G4KHK0_9SACH|nr:LAME_0H15280g1_1 [Lachancea meyersii CBS 8951]
MLSRIGFRSVNRTLPFSSSSLFSRNFSRVGTLKTEANKEGVKTAQDNQLENNLTQQELKDLSSVLEEPSFSIFPSLNDVKPKELVGFQAFGVKSYFVDRSATGNLPVYSDVKRGGKIVTEIRRIRGDPVQLRNDLQDKLKHIPKNRFKVLMESKKVVIDGDVVRQVKQVLSTVF